MGKWVKKSESIYQYFKDEADDGFVGDGIVEKSQMDDFFGGIWYGMTIGDVSLTGNFFNLEDAKKWVEGCVATTKPYAGVRSVDGLLCPNDVMMAAAKGAILVMPQEIFVLGVRDVKPDGSDADVYIQCYRKSITEEKITLPDAIKELALLQSDKG